MKVAAADCLSLTAVVGVVDYSPLTAVLEGLTCLLMVPASLPVVSVAEEEHLGSESGFVGELLESS